LFRTINPSRLEPHLKRASPAELGGNSLVQGSVAVGESKQNLVYDPNASARVVSFGNAGIIQNTWREIPATS
jgi:hypothetical protein